MDTISKKVLNSEVLELIDKHNILVTEFAAVMNGVENSILEAVCTNMIEKKDDSDRVLEYVLKNLKDPRESFASLLKLQFSDCLSNHVINERNEADKRTKFKKV